MSYARLTMRSSRALRSISRPSYAALSSRPFSAYAARLADSKDEGHPNTSEQDFKNLSGRRNDTASDYEARQKSKNLNPHMTNTTSTIHNAMPSIGKDAAPPELVSAVDGNFTPKDSVPENTERMTGGTQGSKTEDVDKPENKELGVGEMEGATFKVEPLRRTGEDVATMRARLLYQSRKRGTLESELLMSTFADANLGSMTQSQLQQYDLFLDENDWDLYYWATQSPDDSPTSSEYAEGAGPDMARASAQGTDMKAGEDKQVREPAPTEWAQTVGTFKPAHRPVPKRWRDSEILALLRRHVKEREGGKGGRGEGIGFMPEVRTFD